MNCHYVSLASNYTPDVYPSRYLGLAGVEAALCCSPTNVLAQLMSRENRETQTPDSLAEQFL